MADWDLRGLTPLALRARIRVFIHGVINLLSLCVSLNFPGASLPLPFQQKHESNDADAALDHAIVAAEQAVGQVKALTQGLGL